MATSAHFKKSARNMADMMNDAGITFDVYQLLNMVDVMVQAGMSFAEPVENVPGQTDWRHEYLVSLACRSHHVLEMVQADRKILAIKELRLIMQNDDSLPTPQSGWLKPAKDAIEDSRVTTAASLWSNPWAVESGRDEPPF